MTQTGEAKVSDRGQMALPAQTRHRWGLDQGGVIGWATQSFWYPVGCSSCVKRSSPTATGMRHAPGSEIRNWRTNRPREL
jgi:bifunctional DNA-binding transcriptional regulator/antitoxin component of YhaV-PrlF toxin-antitoxin module